MSIGIYSNTMNVKVIDIKDINGSTVGSISITKSAKKKLKHLRYSFKYLSSKILMSKTSGSASKALITARATVGMLQQSLKSGNYDDKEIELAIIHAKKMEQVARRKMKHLKEEERAKQTGSCLTDTKENKMPDIRDRTDENINTHGDKLTELMQELQKLMDESMKELADDTGLGELADELTGMIQEDIDSNDLDRLKKKHRANELMEIIEANMKYLKALFCKYEKERQEASNGSSSSNSCSSSGVSLQLSGVDIPIQTSEIPPVTTEGSNVDISI